MNKKQTVLFFGDSITDNGRDYSNPDSLGAEWSYSHCVKLAKKLPLKYPEIDFKFYNRGINGHTTYDLLQRVQKDCIDLKPDVIILLIGINDIWAHGEDDEFTKTNYTKLIQTIKENLKDTKLIIVAPFLLDLENADPTWRKNLERKLKIIDEYIKPHADVFIEPDKLFKSVYTKYITPECFSYDGVHPSEAGYVLIANEILEHTDKIFK